MTHEIHDHSSECALNPVAAGVCYCTAISASLRFQAAHRPGATGEAPHGWQALSVGTTASRQAHLSTFSSLTRPPRDAENHSVPQKSCALSDSQALGPAPPCPGALCQHLRLTHVACPSSFSTNTGLPAPCFPEYTPDCSHSLSSGPTGLYTPGGRSGLCFVLLAISKPEQGSYHSVGVASGFIE